MRAGHWTYVWSLLTLVLLVTLYSWRGGYALLFLAVLLTVIIAQGMVLQLCGPTSIKVDRRYTPKFPRAGTELSITLTITLHGGIAPMWLLVEDDTRIGRGSSKLLFTGWKRQCTHTFCIHDTTRGVYENMIVYVTWGDLFGWFMRTKRVVSDDVLIIHPKSLQTLSEELIPLPMEPENVLFGRLRNYEHGDPLRYVHWKSSARKGTLLTRLSDETTGLYPYLLLDTNRKSYGNDKFEIAVSAAAAWLEKMCRITQAEEITFYSSHLPAAINLHDSQGLHQGLDILAGIRPADGALSSHQLLIHAGHISKSRIITLITGDITSQLVDAILHLSGCGISLEIWCVYDGNTIDRISNEISRLRHCGISVVMLKQHLEVNDRAEKGATRHVIA